MLIETLENMTKKLSVFREKAGYLKEDFHGYTALLTKTKIGFQKTRYGYLLKQDWIVLGSEGLLKKVAVEELSDFPDEIEDMANELLNYVEFKNEYSAVIATWPKFWDIVKQTTVANQFRNSLQRRKTENGVRNKIEILAEFEKLLKNVDSFEVGSPKSKEECTEFVRFEFSRIVADFLGKTLVLASNERTGFRFAAMTFRLPMEENDAK